MTALMMHAVKWSCIKLVSMLCDFLIIPTHASKMTACNSLRGKATASKVVLYTWKKK